MAKRTTTLDYRGVTLEIGYYYQPEEQPETGPDAQYPGSDEQVMIENITHNGVDFYELLDERLEDLEELILNGYKAMEEGDV